jgi:hypothetical protein
MRRRDLFGMIPGVVACVALSKVAVPVAPAGIDYVDAEMCIRRGWNPARVLLNGEDVSHSCTACSETEGWCDLFLRDAEGRITVDDSRFPPGAKKVRRHGVVKWTPNAKG